MANNRLYLIVPGPDGESRQVLLAKGWGNGWQVWNPHDLAERIETALSGEADYAASTGYATTTIKVECEHTQAVQIVEDQELINLRKIAGL